MEACASHVPFLDRSKTLGARAGSIIQLGGLDIQVRRGYRPAAGLSALCKLHFPVSPFNVESLVSRPAIWSSKIATHLC